MSHEHNNQYCYMALKMGQYSYVAKMVIIRNNSVMCLSIGEIVNTMSKALPIICDAQMMSAEEKRNVYISIYPIISFYDAQNIRHSLHNKKLYIRFASSGDSFRDVSLYHIRHIGNNVYDVMCSKFAECPPILNDTLILSSSISQFMNSGICCSDMTECTMPFLVRKNGSPNSRITGMSTIQSESEELLKSLGFSEDGYMCQHNKTEDGNCTMHGAVCDNVRQYVSQIPRVECAMSAPERNVHISLKDYNYYLLTATPINAVGKNIYVSVYKPNYKDTNDHLSNVILKKCASGVILSMIHVFMQYCNSYNREITDFQVNISVQFASMDVRSTASTVALHECKFICNTVSTDNMIPKTELEIEHSYISCKTRSADNKVYSKFLLDAEKYNVFECINNQKTIAHNYRKHHFINTVYQNVYSRIVDGVLKLEFFLSYKRTISSTICVYQIHPVVSDRQNSRLEDLQQILSLTKSNIYSLGYYSDEIAEALRSWNSKDRNFVNDDDKVTFKRKTSARRGLRKTHKIVTSAQEQMIKAIIQADKRSESKTTKEIEVIEFLSLLSDKCINTTTTPRQESCVSEHGVGGNSITALAAEDYAHTTIHAPSSEENILLQGKSKGIPKKKNCIKNDAQEEIEYQDTLSFLMEHSNNRCMIDCGVKTATPRQEFGVSAHGVGDNSITALAEKDYVHTTIHAPSSEENIISQGKSKGMSRKRTWEDSALQDAVLFLTVKRKRYTQNTDEALSIRNDNDSNVRLLSKSRNLNNIQCDNTMQLQEEDKIRA